MTTSIGLPVRDDFAIGSDPRVLDAIRARGLHVALWRRTLAADVSRDLSVWCERAVLQVDTIVHGEELPVFSMPHDEWLRDDLASLLARFRAVSGARDVRLTCTVRRSDACRKFHVDFLRLRLITTYVGPGTEWVPGASVVHGVLADPPACPLEANRRIVRDRRAVRRVRPGDVLLLKGERYQGAPGAVHRSPPIAARGLSRLVLTLSTTD